uniref:NADH-ubiquinone oxidoreductase chain 6 n=1 Tax=Pycanum ochraceum TaxID=299295 RepID=A0A8E7BAA1_9HEMI|nr:NADH dehydrogenase subunit 6 [Pycanum ochraceum]
MSIMFMLMTSLSMLFLWLKHPLSMGLTLICQTLVIALFMGMKLGSFFLSYIIVIIMLSGALVLFIYMTSVASNEKFQTSLKLIIMWMITNFIVYISQDKVELMEGGPFNKMDIKYEEVMLIKMFNSSSGMITIMMIIYLFLTMIVVSNIASSSEGPLRKKS